MDHHIEEFVRAGIPWEALPDEIKSNLSNAEVEYTKIVRQLSLRCQLRYKDNLIHKVYKDERGYYKQMIDYSVENLMVFPYHLSDIFHALQTSPFVYYSSMIRSLMKADRSYDSLPNFTAVDCLRVLGIGRNQYIDLMNQSRLQRNSSLQKFFKKRPVNDLLPKEPANIKIESWWRVRLASVMEVDVNRSSKEEKELIDFLVENKRHPAGKLDLALLKRLYSRCLIFFDVPIDETDTVSLPPLDNFVMNRTSGDEIENLLYKLFQVLDESMTMKELAVMLDMDLKLVLMAVSLMCRLGFCHKRNIESKDLDCHLSWLVSYETKGQNSCGSGSVMGNMIEFLDIDDFADDLLITTPSPGTKSCSSSEISSLANGTGLPLVKELELSAEQSSSRPKLAFLFDSTLTAFLMMGNLTPGLKTHAVTMFEVGKLSDESMDSFITELEKVRLDVDEQEGEAQRYFDHAQILHKTLKALRHNDSIAIFENNSSPGIDLLRCESLLNLDFDICQRLMQKNYQVLISMAPLSQEVSPVSCSDPYHVGPFIPEMNSPWFKLFMYKNMSCGPPSLLLCRGFRLRQLPIMFQSYEKLLVTCWGHDSMLVSSSSCLVMLNDALCNMPVLIQGFTFYADNDEDCTKYLPFPTSGEPSSEHPEVTERLEKLMDLSNGFGFITLVRSCGYGAVGTRSTRDVEAKLEACAEVEELSQHEVNAALDNSRSSLLNDVKEDSHQWIVLDVDYGLPLFDEALNAYVCDKIINTDIFSKERQETFLQSNLEVSKKLLKFIYDCCEIEVKEESIDVQSYIRQRTPLQMPVYNVLYHEGSVKLKLWKF